MGWGSLLWGEGEQESGFECNKLGGPSDTMWRPRRDPRSPQPLSPLGGSYADMGQKLPGKGCDLGGAVRREGPALRDGCRPDGGSQTSLPPFTGGILVPPLDPVPLHTHFLPSSACAGSPRHCPVEVCRGRSRALLTFAIVLSSRTH